MQKTFKKSEEFLKIVSKIIPLGSQTFSKSHTQYPHGVSPFYIERGMGSQVWDIDGNQYTDFVNALAAVTLGYQDPDVDAAVMVQLKKGVSFTLPHRLEYEVAERIVDMVPCAEMVRFGKNGSDATAGTIRLARAFTGRDHVAVCGYHGWQDWYIGSTARNLGVPLATQALTHKFFYNDLSSLEKLFLEYQNNIAAVILEPMNVEFPKDNFLEKVQALSQKYGAVLIFDEVITGFRFAKGGAQEYFGVTPDLAALGKGLANGFPLSAVVGRKDIMSLMDKIFFSFTFGGETMSLAAANATLEKLDSQNVTEVLCNRGTVLESKLAQLITDSELTKVLSVSGHPSWLFLNFHTGDEKQDALIKTYYLQEMMQHGFLGLGTHNLSYAHTEEDIQKLLIFYGDFLVKLKSKIEQDMLAEALNCKVLQPLFSLRIKNVSKDVLRCK